MTNKGHMDKLVVNQKMPRPCSRLFESLRKAALERWKAYGVPKDEILIWAKSGCPDSQGSLLMASTAQPSIPGQGQSDPNNLVEQLIKDGIFLRVDA